MSDAHDWEHGQTLPFVGSPYANPQRKDIRRHCGACGTPAGTTPAHGPCTPDPDWPLKRERQIEEARR